MIKIKFSYSTRWFTIKIKNLCNKKSRTLKNTLLGGGFIATPADLWYPDPIYYLTDKAMVGALALVPVELCVLRGRAPRRGKHAHNLQLLKNPHVRSRQGWKKPVKRKKTQGVIFLWIFWGYLGFCSGIFRILDLKRSFLL